MYEVLGKTTCRPHIMKDPCYQEAIGKNFCNEETVDIML